MYQASRETIRYQSHLSWCADSVDAHRETCPHLVQRASTSQRLSEIVWRAKLTAEDSTPLASESSFAFIIINPDHSLGFRVDSDLSYRAVQTRASHSALSF